MSFPYQKILVIGATSGIGYAMAEKFVKENRSVILVGRRKEKLDEFARNNGGYGDKIASYVFDITKLEEIPAWVEKVTEEHPSIDSIFLNSGIQQYADFSKPVTVDLAAFQIELTTNYTSYIHLTTAFLPFLLKQEQPVSLIYTTSGLGLIPIPRCLGYCATKAALHQFLIGLRLHLKETNVKVLEIMPPAVQTPLLAHNIEPYPLDVQKFGMPLATFVDETWNMLLEGNIHDEFPIGEIKSWYAAVESGRKYIMSTFPDFLMTI